MLRTRRIRLYLSTALVICVVWFGVQESASTHSWAIPLLPLPVVNSQNGNTKGDLHTARRTSDNSDTANSPERQRTMAWEAEQRRRKAALNTACRKWLPKSSEYLPKGEVKLYHLAVDKKHKAMYCFMGKVASTNWKRLWMILTGLSNADDPLDIPKKVPHWLASKMNMSFQKKRVPGHEIQHQLDTYKKLLVVRDPYERLLSAYRDRLEGEKHRAYDDIAEEIKKLSRNSGKKTNTTVTFSEFVSYVTNLSSESDFDKHWRPYHRLCHPCDIRYTVIAKYETLAEDSERFLRLIGAPENLHFPKYVPSNTSSILPQYMSRLTKAQRRKLFKVYQRDFEAFGYQPYGGLD